MSLSFGVWDSFERLSGMPEAQQYEERLQLVKEAERAGFYGYHLAEHHLSPLSMAPSPLLFLTAVAQRTSRIRIGSMVTILPLYPTVRLVQEICMVDALSNGRFELGVGRGIRDAEHEWFGRDPTRTKEHFNQSLERVRGALMTGKIEVDSPGGGTNTLPLVHEPTQRPTPRFWYVGNMDFAAEQGMSVLARRPTRQEIETFTSTFHQKRAAGSPLHQGPEPLVGATRPTFVANTDSEAEKIATRSWDALGDHFYATDTRSGGRSLPPGSPVGSFGGGDVHRAFENGDVVYGSPRTVSAILAESLTAAGPGFNYLVSSFQWGDLTHEEAMRSLNLFATQVAPGLRAHHDQLR